MKRIAWLLLVSSIFFACSKSDSGYVNNPGTPEYLHNRPVGASARELLSAATYLSLKVEILYMTGYAPDPAAISHLQSTLTDLLNKPGGVSIVTKEIPASSSGTMSVNDVIAIEKIHRTAFTSSSEIAVCITYTNGKFTDAGTLGVAYRNTSAALFGGTIHSNSGGIGQVSRTKLEATVLEHEISHLLGLVDIGSPMQTPHKDAAHGNHCNNSNCLMHYASETTDILGFLLTGNIPSLDANCRADLQANGGK
jgi:hypothetical protein